MKDETRFKYTTIADPGPVELELELKLGAAEKDDYDFITVIVLGHGGCTEDGVEFVQLRDSSDDSRIYVKKEIVNVVEKMGAFL